MTMRDISSIIDRHFDVVISGGGIYGAWTAYDAALRGLKVALFEQGDWASATSSASSKLIHGGLRYLESLHIGLVRKTLAERQMLLDVAPHRVWPLRFGVPVYQHSRIGRLRVKAGLTLYDMLAGALLTDQAHRRFNQQQFAKRFACFDTAQLLGGFTYSDAQTDDARLVLELIDGAKRSGAICLNYCRVSETLYKDGQFQSLKIEDRLSGDVYTVSAQQAVNTTGQWIRESGAAQTNCRLTKGVHLVLPNVLDREAVLLTAPSDGRVFFMIPWYGLTLLGTTDTEYHGDPNQVTINAQDIDYLLTAANAYLKNGNWKEQDIIGKFVGLRVMQGNADQAPSSLSRDWELKTSGNGIYYSIGGKITSARQDASQIVDTLCHNIGNKVRCQTKHRMFPWAPQQQWSVWSENMLQQAENLGMDSESAFWLLRRHGNRVSEIFKLIANQPDLGNRILPPLPFINAELIYCAGNEMVIHLEDLLRRRIPLLILAKMSPQQLQQVAVKAAATLGWEEQKLNWEITQCSRKWL